MKINPTMNQLINKQICANIFSNVTHTHIHSITCVIFAFSSFLLQLARDLFPRIKAVRRTEMQALQSVPRTDALFASAIFNWNLPNERRRNRFSPFCIRAQTTTREPLPNGVSLLCMATMCAVLHLLPWIFYTLTQFRLMLLLLLVPFQFVVGGLVVFACPVHLSYFIWFTFVFSLAWKTKRMKTDSICSQPLGTS